MGFGGSPVYDASRIGFKSVGDGSYQAPAAPAFPSYVTPSAGGSAIMGTAGGAGATPAVGTPAWNPSSTTVTPTNPLQEKAYGNTEAALGTSNTAFDAAKNFEAGIANGTNEETQRELERSRDQISVGMKKEGESAMSRGADPTLFRTRALETGRRSLNDLQGTLASAALDKHTAAINSEIGAAGGVTGAAAGTANAAQAAASEQRLTAQGNEQNRLEGQRVANETADTQARLQEAPYDRLLKTMETIGNYRDGFASLTSGSGFF